MHGPLIAVASPVEEHGLLIAVASLVEEHGLQVYEPQQLWHAGSVVVACRPSRSMACGILPDQGLNPCPLHWQADSQPLRHQGSPEAVLLNVGQTAEGTEINLRKE